MASKVKSKVRHNVYMAITSRKPSLDDCDMIEPVAEFAPHNGQTERKTSGCADPSSAPRGST